VPAGDQLVKFIDKLIDGLLDVQSHCSSASCIFLNHCVKLRGGELKEQVSSINSPICQFSRFANSNFFRLKILSIIYIQN